MDAERRYTSAVDVTIDQVSELVLTLEPGRWNGISLRKFHNFANQKLSVPPVAEHVLAIQSGTTEVAGEAGRRFGRRLSPDGNVLVLPRGEPTEWEWSDPVSQLHVYVEPQFLEDVAVQTLGLDPARVELVPRFDADDPLVVQIGLALEREAKTPGAVSQLYVDSLTQALAIHLLRQYGVFQNAAPPREGGFSAQTLNHVKEYVETHLTNELTLEELAGVAGISAYHFARCFRRMTGWSPHQYVVERRLETAKQLLIEGKQSIALVAALTGFADQSHLQRLFKRRYGVTPASILGQRTNLQYDRTNLQDRADGSE